MVDNDDPISQMNYDEDVDGECDLEEDGIL